MIRLCADANLLRRAGAKVEDRKRKTKIPLSERPQQSEGSLAVQRMEILCQSCED